MTTKTRHRRPASRRGFTLLELVLAAMLGAIVLIASVGLFEAIGKTEKHSKRRHEAVMELTRLHRTMTKALANMVLTPPTLANTAPATANAAAATPPIEEPPIEPRLILESDAMTGRQRLEMVLAEPPVLGSADGLVSVPEAERYAMLRGAFEMRDTTTAGIMDMWFVSYVADGMVDPAAMDAEGKPLDPSAAPVMPVVGPDGRRSHSVRREMLIASGLTEVKWTLYRTNDAGELEDFAQLAATSRQEIPAYAELHVKTAQGPSAKWLFEVGWSEVQDADRAMMAFVPDTRPVITNPAVAGGAIAGATPGGPAPPGGGTVVAVTDPPATGGPGIDVVDREAPRLDDSPPVTGPKPSITDSDRIARERYLRELERYRRSRGELR